MLKQLFRRFVCWRDGHAWTKNYNRSKPATGPHYFCSRCNAPKPVRTVRLIE